MAGTLKIAHVLTRLLRAGSEENTLAIARWQKSAGHQVVVVHGADFDPALREDVARDFEVVTIPAMIHPISPVADVRAVLDLAGYLRRGGFDVVHTHQSKAGVVGRAAAKLAGVRGVVHGVHILPFEGEKGLKRLAYLGIEQVMAPLTDAFIAVSPGVRDISLEAGIGRARDYFVAFSPMDLSRFKTAEPSGDISALKSGGANLAALMVAAFEPRKRQLEFIQALAAAPRAPLHIYFAGTGKMQAACQEAAEKLGVADRVTFLGWRGDPERLMAAADVGVLVSEREGLPRVAVQYLGAGLPVMITEVGGLSGLIQSGGNGKVFGPGEISAVVAELSRLAASPQDLKVMSDGAKATDLTRWSTSESAAETMRAYEHALRT